MAIKTLPVSKTKPILGWWFACKRSLAHGDDRPIRIGRAHLHRGTLELCERGLHASRNVLAALAVASTGNLLYRVACSGQVIEFADKLVCSRRHYIAVIEAKQLLWRFARLCALDVIHLWEPPEIVYQYLRSGDEHLRIAACDAVWPACSDVAAASARTAARYACFNRVCTAADLASRFASQAAAWGPARPAIWDFEQTVAKAAARKKHNRRLYRMAMREIAAQRQKG